MDKFLISGPCKIRGEVSISGSKNAALPILASTLLIALGYSKSEIVNEFYKKELFSFDSKYEPIIKAEE